MHNLFLYAVVVVATALIAAFVWFARRSIIRANREAGQRIAAERRRWKREEFRYRILGGIRICIAITDGHGGVSSLQSRLESRLRLLNALVIGFPEASLAPGAYRLVGQADIFGGESGYPMYRANLRFVAGDLDLFEVYAENFPYRDHGTESSILNEIASVISGEPIPG